MQIMQDVIMMGPPDAEIVQRAKALCHADGNVWKVCERPGHGAANRIVDDASRAEYLARARDQLMREQAGAASPQRS